MSPRSAAPRHPRTCGWDGRAPHCLPLARSSCKLRRLAPGRTYSSVSFPSFTLGHNGQRETEAEAPCASRRSGVSVGSGGGGGSSLFRHLLQWETRAWEQRLAVCTGEEPRVSPGILLSPGRAHGSSRQTRVLFSEGSKGPPSNTSHPPFCALLSVSPFFL